MRSIAKGAESKALRDWKRQNAGAPQNLHYDNLSGKVKDAMLVQLVREQGGLCAYTMKRIESCAGTFQAHIEHLLPRSAHPGLSVDWKNLVACVPRPGVACDYGAVRKGAYDPAVAPFVNPTKTGVEAQFRFRVTGEVDGCTPDADATLAAEVLNLKHADLAHDRAAKIKGALLHKPTAARARQRAQELRKPDRHGNFEPYCEAVAQVLENYAQRLENRARRLAGARR